MTATVAMLRSIAWLLAGAAALCVALLGAAFLFFSLLLPGVSFAQFEWVATENGYIAQQVSERDQKVCVCEAYECGGDAEPVHIAFDGWLRRSYAIIIDPMADSNDLRWGRKVVTNTACISKPKGDQISYTLTKLFNDGTGPAENARLLLEIK